LQVKGWEDGCSKLFLCLAWYLVMAPPETGPLPNPRHYPVHPCVPTTPRERVAPVWSAR